jgi:hypothetical protein
MRAGFQAADAQAIDQSYVIEGLKPSTAYKVKVHSKNNLGTSLYSSINFVTVEFPVKKNEIPGIAGKLQDQWDDNQDSKWAMFYYGCSVLIVFPTPTSHPHLLLPTLYPYPYFFGVGLGLEKGW